jgi:hypothetical protein
MATRACDCELDLKVPCADVTDGFGGHSGRRSSAAKSAIEIAGRAAWLAWQIGEDDLTAPEARQQLSRIADDLARCEERFPHDLRARVSGAFRLAQMAAVADDLAGLRQASQQMRVVLEQYHNAIPA